MRRLKEFNQFTDLDGMIQSDEYQIFESETLLDPQYHIINNTDKDIDEMTEYNEGGMFGCSHGEFIECFKEFLDSLAVWESKYNTKSEKEEYDISLQVYNRISKEIERCEEWHIKHNTIDEIL
jgi:hypothetical protein